ncbi:hypothetical protein [Salipiger marinus]|uniref:Uncharacterized protein n=1 Tax=Salipiger marinus TaxID=555512 RepID=A0A1G8LK06_9RHOB|nr:hypothetical protein [Salipiger marinus]SDI56059.1 hypothetical protein SAMN04487993_1006212 [Salipiger marinus]
MIRNILAAALCAALSAVAGLGLLLHRERQAGAALAQDNAALDVALTGCSARVLAITRDKESDHAIDQLPDFDLRHVPDHWLR